MKIITYGPSVMRRSLAKSKKKKQVHFIVFFFYLDSIDFLRIPIRIADFNTLFIAKWVIYKATPLVKITKCKLAIAECKQIIGFSVRRRHHRLAFLCHHETFREFNDGDPWKVFSVECTQYHRQRETVTLLLTNCLFRGDILITFRSIN